MANSPTFVEYALDLLSLVEGVEARRMFGGHGLYRGGVMFGLLDDDELFLKADEQTRPRFEEAGCRNWVYPGAPGTTSYWRPPDAAHEDPESMLPWARLALEAADRRHVAKVAEAAAKAARRAAREKAASARGRKGRRAAPSRPSGRKRSSRDRSP
jgi:DNA transformation protein and related proteins